MRAWLLGGNRPLNNLLERGPRCRIQSASTNRERPALFPRCFLRRDASVFPPPPLSRTRAHCAFAPALNTTLAHESNYFRGNSILRRKPLEVRRAESNFHRSPFIRGFDFTVLWFSLLGEYYWKHSCCTLLFLK